jgi:hypothetical protein
MTRLHIFPHTPSFYPLYPSNLPTSLTIDFSLFFQETAISNFNYIFSPLPLCNGLLSSVITLIASPARHHGDSPLTGS